MIARIRNRYCLLGLFIFLSKLGYSQEMENIKKQDPFSIRGNVAASIGGYGVKGIPPRNNHFLWSVSGNPSLSFYGVELPFSFIFSESNQSFRQPFNQFGVSPHWKWITGHAGFRNLTWSNYTLAGATFLGVGIDINPSLFRFGAMYGRFQKPIEEDTTTTLDDGFSGFSQAAFKRKGWGFKLGVGKEQQFFDLIFLKVKDDSTSIKRPLTQEIFPQENAVIGFNTEYFFAKHFTFKANAAISLFTKDLGSNPYDQGDFPMKKFLNFLVAPTISTQFYYAAQASFGVKYDAWNVLTKYERVAPDYKSLGAYYFQTDMERITISPGFSIKKNKFKLQSSIGFQHDNLNKNKAAATKRVIGSVNININPSQKYGMTIQYSNYGISQKPGTKSLSDTTRVDQVSQSISLTPRFNFGKQGKTLHNFVWLNTFQNLNDKRTDTGTVYEMKMMLSNANYNFLLIEQQLNINVNSGYNHNILAFGNTSSVQLGLGINKSLMDNKLQTGMNFNYNKNFFKGNSNGATYQAVLNLGYVPAKNHQIQGEFNYLRNKSDFAEVNESFSEYTGRVTYTYTFNYIAHGKDK